MSSECRQDSNNGPSDEEDFTDIQTTLDNCQFQCWYPRFRDHTINSVVIPLPDEFIQYLNEDSVFLPRRGRDAPKLECEDMYEAADKSEIEAVRAAAQVDDEIDTRSPNFPELEEQITKAIADLGGEVFPKLNWSSPKDATWASATNSLKCYTPTDIFLLLKCSDVISHDFFVVLREYISFHQSNEFRCFIRNKELIAISQRQNIHFPFLSREARTLCDLIAQFWAKHVREQFPEKNYVLDVYVTPKKKVLIVDFNVWGPSTMPLLFSWDELRNPAFPPAAPPPSSLSPPPREPQPPRPYVLRLVPQGTPDDPRLPFEDELALATNRFPLEFLSMGRDGALDAVMNAAREQQQEDTGSERSGKAESKTKEMA